jgi:hypothetical protein
LLFKWLTHVKHARLASALAARRSPITSSLSAIVGRSFLASLANQSHQMPQELRGRLPSTTRPASSNMRVMTNMNYRGMVVASLRADGLLQIEHRETQKALEFKPEDLDEVIGVLIDFRNELKAGRVDGAG